MAQSSPRKPEPTPVYRSGTDDWVAAALEWAGGKILFVGILATLACTVGLIYYAMRLGQTMPNAEETQRFSEIIAQFGTYLVASIMVFALGMAIMFWGDIALGAVLFLVAIAYFFAPVWTGAIGIIPESPSDLSRAAVDQLGRAGLYLGVVAMIIQAIDAFIRLRNRAIYGARGDLLKYGAGIKEERDYQNVFMGKCWQLPFCRKFVREKCPIYHSRRTCWRERVGCMCEEQVIRDAMEGKVIPKDAVAAAKFIPRNNRLTPAQKAERCRQCVIYNEHQRHKYRLAVPMCFLVVFGLYVLLHQPLLESTHEIMKNFDVAMSNLTIKSAIDTGQRGTIGTTPGILEEFVLFAVVLFVFSQIMKAVEFAIFKLKI
ncbi:MAG: hypothetical protein KatS3mg015_0422 [Fimbriimonadales bacterium]|nr:MAG: hypothetical protein KatS3mg015_0422 [Fimbriimonadales bacterium]